MISIVIIGAGNLGTHLCRAISKAENLELKQWYNRSLIPKQSGLENIPICNELVALKKADLYIVAVSDSAIETISDSLSFENRLVVHTSGSLGLRFLNKKNRRGVFYPLQTFSKTSKVCFTNVPICVESLNKKDRLLLKSVAESLGSSVYCIQTEQRQALHLTAVFVNNFTNQLYRIAHELTDRESLDFEILKPLIMETANKVQTLSPYLAQTGPAKRRDKKTIKQHIKRLESDPSYQAIYEMLTNSIQKTHG